VTTKKFLEAFGFASLRDLPDLERLADETLLEKGLGDDLDGVLGLMDTNAEGALGEARAAESD
jgi:segregation and condensation protein B